MDTSKEYIKMCDCEEIQGVWGLEPLDIFWDTFKISIDFGKQFYVGYPSDYDEPFEKMDTYIWLPRQDQLQEMVIDTELKGWGAASAIANKFHKWQEAYCDIYTWDWSMEMLWLAFVMLIKYNKVWSKVKIESVTESKGIVTSGKKWIKNG